MATGYGFGLLTTHMASMRRTLRSIPPNCSIQHGNTTEILEGLTSRLADAGLPLAQAEDSALQILDNTVTKHTTVLAHNDVFWMLALRFVLSLPLLGLLGRQPRKVTLALA